MLDQVEARYLPTVIKTPAANSNNSDHNNETDADDKEANPLHQLLNENWISKRHPRSSAIFPTTLDYHQAYKSQTTTPKKVAQTLLPLIRRGTFPPGEHSTAFLTTLPDLVLKAAEESAARYAAGKPLSPLDGVPIAVKDENDLAGYTKTLASKLNFTHRDPEATSFCVQQLLNAGAVCVGKTNMHELGLDTTNLNPLTGTPRNPYHSGYYTGGSSGGSAYAVASGLAPLAVGNDGGGSIRIPAGYCGVYGLKPSHGRVSGRPGVSLAKSTAVVGPMAGGMLDLEIGYRVMAQPDSQDSDAAMFAPPGSVKIDSQPTDQRASTAKGEKKVLGIFGPWFDRCDPEVHNLCQTAINYLTGHHSYTIHEITLPHLPEGQLAHAMTILSEIASGIPAPSLPLLSAPNQILLSIASQTPAADFLQAQKLRNLLMQHLAALFEENPGMVIVTPTTPNAGRRIEQKGDLRFGVSDGNKQVRSMEYVWLANFTGCPAISCPVGYLPVEVVVAKGKGKGEGEGG